MIIHWPHPSERRPICRPVLTVVGQPSTWMVTDDPDAVTCSDCLKALDREPKQAHPCCRAHVEDPVEPCTCAEWWAEEARDIQLFAGAACKSCGDMFCEGGEACRENNIALVREARDVARALNRDLRGRFYTLRQRLMIANGLEPDRRLKPTIEELLEQLMVKRGEQREASGQGSSGADWVVLFRVPPTRA